MLIPSGSVSQISISPLVKYGWQLVGVCCSSLNHLPPHFLHLVCDEYVLNTQARICQSQSPPSTCWRSSPVCCCIAGGDLCKNKTINRKYWFEMENRSVLLLVGTGYGEWMIVTHSIYPSLRQPPLCQPERVFTDVVNSRLIIKHTLLLRELCGRSQDGESVNIKLHTHSYTQTHAPTHAPTH